MPLFDRETADLGKVLQFESYIIVRQQTGLYLLLIVVQAQTVIIYP